MCKENRNKSRAHRQKNMSRDINQCQLDENARVRDDRKSGPGERRQSKVLCKTRLILLSVCQAVLIWPGLHRDKVLVMNLSKRIRGTWRWGWGGGEQEGKGGGKGGVHMGISRVSGSRKYFIKGGQDPGDWDSAWRQVTNGLPRTYSRVGLAEPKHTSKAPL